MTQLTLSMLLKAEGAPAAKAAIQDVAKSTTDLGTATTRGATADRAAATAKQANAAASRTLATANRSAAGATDNLVAQLNDIFMMIGSGQNPLQTAIQQGTQITQVIGPMGAGGAVKALGGAFVSLLNPINLIIPAAILAGSVMVQWLTQADDDAAGVTEELERQKTALQGVIDETERLRLAQGMKLTGAQSENEQIVLEEITRLTNERAAAQERLNSLKDIGSRVAGYAEQAAAQREVLNAEIASLDAKIAALQKQRELNAATEENRAAAQSLKVTVDAVASAIARAASGDLSGPFVRAQGAANALLGIANNILAALGQAAAQRAASQDKLGQMAIEFSPGGQNMLKYGGRTPGGTSSQNALATRNRPITVGSGSGSGSSGAGSGGGAAAREEANALQDLITSLEDEIEALRVQDPIQQEMLKNREALAGATEAEKKKVEELIATREREQLLMEGAKARAAFFEDLGNNALEALIVKGESFNDVLKNIAQSLIQAAIQAALFGSGPFGSLFGGKSVLSMIFPALGAGKAAGGRVFGPGDGTRDTFLTPTANGEYIVNAKATARNLHLLEAINSGAQVTAGRAMGGMVGGASEGRRYGSRGGGGPSTLVIDVRGAQGNTEVRELVRQGVQIGLQMYDREALPRSVQRVSADAKRVN